MHESKFASVEFTQFSLPVKIPILCSFFILLPSPSVISLNSGGPRATIADDSSFYYV